MDNLEEQGIELPPSHPNEEEEVGEEEEEEENEEDEEEEEGEEAEEEWEEEDEEENEEEQGGYTVDDVDMDGRSGTTSHQLLVDNHENVEGLPFENANDVTVEIERECSKLIDDSKGGPTASLKYDCVKENGELNRDEIDGLFCPICFEAWSSGGDHHVCCLPCGHIYGLSCIQRWLRRQGSSKCPQCKKKCGIKDIRLLYATRVVATDGELQKTVRSLEAKCVSLEKKTAGWSKKEVEWKKREADLCKEVRYLKKKRLSSDDGGEQKEDDQAQPTVKEDLRATIQALVQKMQTELALMRQDSAELCRVMQEMQIMIRMMHEWHLSQGHYPPPPPELQNMSGMIRMMHEWHQSQGHYPPPPPQ